MSSSANGSSPTSAAVVVDEAHGRFRRLVVALDRRSLAVTRHALVRQGDLDDVGVVRRLARDDERLGELQADDPGGDLHAGNLLGRRRDGDDVRDDVRLLLPADDGRRHHTATLLHDRRHRGGVEARSGERRSDAAPRPALTVTAGAVLREDGLATRHVARERAARRRGRREHRGLGEDERPPRRRHRRPGSGATRAPSEAEPDRREVPEARRQPQQQRASTPASARPSGAPSRAASDPGRPAPSRRRRRRRTSRGASGPPRAHPASGSRGSSRSGRRPAACTGTRSGPTSGGRARSPAPRSGRKWSRP